MWLQVGEASGCSAKLLAWWMRSRGLASGRAIGDAQRLPELEFRAGSGWWLGPDCSSHDRTFSVPI